MVTSYINNTKKNSKLKRHYIDINIILGGIVEQQGQEIELSKVLVADDDPKARSLLIEVVISKVTNGIKVNFIEADNGAEALKLYKQEGPFDLVLTDGQMPEMDGLELAKEIFEDNVNQPLVIISGHPNTLETAARSNICHIRKPYDVKILMKEINKALGA